jgi:hypothetical protein
MIIRNTLAEKIQRQIIVRGFDKEHEYGGCIDFFGRGSKNKLSSSKHIEAIL